MNDIIAYILPSASKNYIPDEFIGTIRYVSKVEEFIHLYEIIGQGFLLFDSDLIINPSSLILELL